MRRWTAAGALLALVAAALVAAVVLSTRDGDGAAGPTLAGVPLARCLSPECPEADAAVVESPWGAGLAVRGLPRGFRAVSAVAVEGGGGPCPADVRAEGERVRAFAPAGRYRLVLAAGAARFGALLVSPGDQGQPEPGLSWEVASGHATLLLENPRGVPFDVTGTVWTVTGTVGGVVTVRVDAADGRSRWDPPGLGVSTAVAGPICRDRPAALTLTRLPAGVALAGSVVLPGGRELTATAG